MIVIYAHCRLNCYDVNRTIEDPLFFDTPELPWHVIQTLDIFNEKKYKVHFFTTNKSTPLYQIQAEKKKLLLNNTSFDFGIYKTAILEMLDEGKTDNLIIMNDGCFMIPENLYRLENEWIKYDFLGISYNNEHPKPHLQSYFILFTKKIVESPEFRNYWENIIQYNWNKFNTIEQGECSLTQYFASYGYKFGYFCRFNSWHMGWANPQCQRLKSPVLKIKQNEGIYLRQEKIYKKVDF